MNIWIVLLNIGIFVLLAYGTWILYEYVEKKGWIVSVTHVYTNKKTYTYYWEFLRILLLGLLVIVSLIFQKWMVAIVGFFVSLIYTYTVISRNRKENQEKVIATWEYSREDMQKWKEWIRKEKDKKGKENKRIQKQVSKKVVITSKHIYFSKRKRMSIVKDDFHYLKIDKIEREDDMLLFTYSYLTFPIRIYAIPIGTNEKNIFFHTLLKHGIVCYNEGKK